MPSLRVGIIGCGYAAEKLHLPALKRIPDLEAAALADPDRQRLERLGDTWGISTRCDDPISLINDPTIDVLAICTPSNQHAPLAMMALQAGKHVLLEKPLAITLEEADQLIAAAAASDRILMVGHNLRWHPFVIRARQSISAGALGEIRRMETVFNTPLMYRKPIPEWRQSTTSGGGVLLDLAVHHLDLWRFLTDAEVESLTASIDLHNSIDTVAHLTGQLTNGITAESRFSHFNPDEHTLFIEGTRGSIQLSMYRADGFSIQYKDGSQRLSGAFQRMIDGLQMRSKGGVMPESYRYQWQAFAQAIKTGTQPNLTHDRSALQLALQARESAQSSTSVVASGEPKLTAIVVIPDEFETVRHTLICIREQSVRDQIEIVIVRVGCEDSPVDEDLLNGFHNWQLFDVPAGTTTGEAKTIAVRQARAPIIVHTEDHASPRAGWAEAIIKTHEGPYVGVGPQVANGNPQTLVSWADYVIGYAPWMYPTPSGEIADLPGHNSSYKRDVLLTYGDRLPDMINAETVMNIDLRSKGHRLAIAEGAVIDHLNIEKPSTWLTHIIAAARMFGGARAANWSFMRRLVYIVGSPLIPFVRAFRIIRSMLQPGRPKHMIPIVTPVMLLGLYADAFGQFLGYVAGPGSSAQDMYDMEFHRERHFTHKQ